MKAHGRLSWNPKGFAFVVCEESADVFIPASELAGALDGDIVEVEAYQDRKGLRGRVINIVQRGNLHVAGTYRRKRKWGELLPTKPFPYAIIIPHGSDNGAQNGDLVVARIDAPRQVKRIDTVTALVLHTLGIPEDVGDDLRFVAIKHGLPWLFSEQQEETARSLALFPAGELEHRRDLRAFPLFTIDGATARDFDDAVGVEALADGTYRMLVAIADVAHYIRPGEILDKEAYQRGFSVYFPEAAIPMLPEALSNGICSLKPGEDRLAMVAEIILGPRGKWLSSTCYEAVIRSRARLVYEEISPFLEGRGPAPAGTPPEVAQALQLLHRLTGYFNKRRAARGGLDLDLPEAAIILDSNGEVASVGRRPRGAAERLIEEAMLLANQVACRFLLEHGLPTLFRVHEAPAGDDLLDLVQTLTEIDAPKELTAALSRAASAEAGVNKALQAVADAFGGHHLETFVHQQVLRSMRQAVYQHEDVGHFGLACTGYLHFTSPIRRYPDLIVHRLMKLALRPERSAEKELGKWRRFLKYAGPELSKRERVTNEAMLEVIKLKTAAYMAHRVGETFTGVVTNILDFGMFVQIADPPTDGLVSMNSLNNARVVDNRRLCVGKRSIALGDTVQVRLERVDVKRGLIDFILDGEPENRLAAPARGGEGKPAKKERPATPKGAERAPRRRRRSKH